MRGDLVYITDCRTMLTVSVAKFGLLAIYNLPLCTFREILVSIKVNKLC